MVSTKLSVFFAVVGLAACGTDSSSPTPAGTDTPPGLTPPGTGTAVDPAVPPTTPTTPPAAGAGCGAKSTLTLGDQDLTITVGAASRVVHVHVPKTYDANKAAPLVFDFHGYLSNGPEQDGYAGMSAKADKAGFIAVHAEGTNHSWNGGACCGDAVTQKVDDIAYVGQVLNEIESKSCIDEKRVYSTGFSNGGFLSQRIACELGDRFAAIAPVSGVLGIPPASCTPKRAVPILEFHGTSDPIVGFNGSPQYGYPSVADTVAGWVTRDGCNATPAQTFNSGDTKCATYSGCAGGAEVVLCTIDQGGHTWPGGKVPVYLGKTTTAINATDALWDFFVKHPLP